MFYTKIKKVSLDDKIVEHKVLVFEKVQPPFIESPHPKPVYEFNVSEAKELLAELNKIETLK